MRMSLWQTFPEGTQTSCMELGLRQSKNKITVQIGEAGRLPFDVAAIRTIEFPFPRRFVDGLRGASLCVGRSGADTGGRGVCRNHYPLRPFDRGF